MKFLDYKLHKIQITEPYFLQKFLEKRGRFIAAKSFKKMRSFAPLSCVILCFVVFSFIPISASVPFVVLHGSSSSPLQFPITDANVYYFVFLVSFDCMIYCCCCCCCRNWRSMFQQRNEEIYRGAKPVVKIKRILLVRIFVIFLQFCTPKGFRRILNCLIVMGDITESKLFIC